MAALQLRHRELRRGDASCEEANGCFELVAPLARAVGRAASGDVGCQGVELHRCEDADGFLGCGDSCISHHVTGMHFC